MQTSWCAAALMRFSKTEPMNPQAPRATIRRPITEMLSRAQAFFKSAYRQFAILNPARHGAALAYYGMFSLIPILAIGYLLVYRLLSDQALTVLAEFRTQLSTLVGEAVVLAVQEQVAETALRPQAGSLLVALISLLVILYTASGAFAQLKYSLNTVWAVPHETQLSPRPMILTRLLGVAIVIGIGFLLVLAVGAYLLIATVSSWLGLVGALPILNALAAILLITFSFAVLYKILPDAPVSWSGAWRGAILAALVAMVGLGLVTLYFRFVRLNTALSVAGGVAIVLIGINYLAQIFLFGAVFSRVAGDQPEGVAPDNP
jgi:membrane protein